MHTGFPYCEGAAEHQDMNWACPRLHGPCSLSWHSQWHLVCTMLTAQNTTWKRTSWEEARPKCQTLFWSSLQSSQHLELITIQSISIKEYHSSQKHSSPPRDKYPPMFHRPTSFTNLTPKWGWFYPMKSEFRQVNIISSQFDSPNVIWSNQLPTAVCKKNNLAWWMKLISKFSLINYLQQAQYVPPSLFRNYESP